MMVYSEDLRPGMKVKNGNKIETIGAFRGECEHGIHFGSGCYDKICRWEVVQQWKDGMPVHSTGG